MDSSKFKTLTISKELKDQLDSAKVSSYEPYSSVIKRSLIALKKSNE